ncbi:adhesin-like protein [Ectocarpus siliculosus]|uniref:Adhesin-like protein n=1 Tax=Ectocarpus siliculosus TaxID=2880 RepID=D7G0B0_ECTSI|nr:adhesin-like protein [Ectocarpus siliculosus]|eukprot:CBJ26637.1 adhesin-like protein [Ectocarpus siliculosus]
MGTFAAASATTTSSTSGTSSSGNSSSTFPSSTQEGEEAETTAPTGPLFFVDGGQLFLDSLAVRGGYTSNSTGSFTYAASTDAAADGTNSTTTSGVNETAIATVVISGGGVHAIDSNVTVTGCEFEENYADYWGGGIFANGSTLVVHGSVFRRCEAGEVPLPGDEDVDGAGGAIGAEFTDVLVDGCLFEKCFASKKGGGMHQGIGQISVLDSVFYNNTAGSTNIEDDDEIGEGGAISFTVCNTSFDGLAACGANDTVFFKNDVGRKGGAIVIGSGRNSSYVELHRCTVEKSESGLEIEDDPQGEGGAVAVAWGITLLVADSLLTDNYCGKKGGVVTLSSGEGFPGDAVDEPGPVVILRNSTFTDNWAHLDNAGVVNLGEFATLLVEGDDNVFAGNECGQNGAVFGATTDTVIVIEGGTFFGNEAADGGGVIWTKGDVTILGGNFSGNDGAESGGVVLASEESTIFIAGGLFQGNEALDGGVVFVGEGAAVEVEGGVFDSNLAGNGGGAFAAEEGGHINITQGTFTNNEADFGGFLYKEGPGNASCTGASVVGHRGVDGGAVYAVEGAKLEWGCDLVNNSALAGPAIYARDNAEVVLRGVELYDNVVARGSVVFIVSSNLTTYQTVFTDTEGSSDLSAVQADEDSSYKAEDTSFVGFAGEAVVFSEGILYLDDCDFSGSAASVLVYSERNSTTVVRNAVLGDNNYFDVAEAASEAGDIPTAHSLISVNVTCDGWMPFSSTPPCSEGSPCIDGDLGVYCQCYTRESSIAEGSPSETCVTGDPGLLSLTVLSEPADAVYPTMLDGDLLLTLNDDETVTTSSSAGGSGVALSAGAGTEGGVIWNVSALVLSSEEGLMEWTVFPSTGLLLPGRSITLHVVTLPLDDFNGEATVSFQADGMSPPASLVAEAAAAVVVQTTSLADDGEGETAAASFDVSFVHCESGTYWNNSCDPEGDSVSCCELCTDVDGDEDGVNCDENGATTRTLPIQSGYWRASLDSVYIRQCFNEDACQGGSIVASEQEYCNAGYEGPQCAVCASGYGRGVANACHLCTASFKGGMYFVLAVAALLTLFVAALLAVYLVGGRGAVSTTMTNTRESVRMLQRRGSGLLRSEGTTRRFHFSASGGGSSGGHPTKGSSALKSVGEESDGGESGGSGRFLGAWGRRKSASIGAPPPGAITTSSAAGSGPSSSVNDKGAGSKADSAGTVGAGFVPLARSRAAAAAAGGTAASSILVPPTMQRADNEEEADVSNNTVGSSSSGRGLQPSAAPAVRGPGGGGKGAREGQQQGGGGGDRKKKTAAARIGEMLARLPLSKLKIVVVVWQISNAFAEITKVPFPPVYEKFLSIIGIFSFDLGWMISAACLTAGIDFYDKLLRGKGASRTAMAAAAAAERARQGRARPSARRVWRNGPGDESDLEQNHLWELFARHTTMMLIILYLVYTQVSTVVFQAFACEDFPEIGKSFLRADFRIECDTPKHDNYKIYAAVMICISFWYFLTRQRSRINPPTDKGLKDQRGRKHVVDEKMNQRRTDRAIAPTSFLWNAYYPNRYYYEVFECMRRLLLTGLLVFLVPDTPGQVAFGCVFAFLSLLAFELLRPHTDHLDMQLYRTGCLVIFFTNFLALMIKANVASPDSRGSEVYSVVLIIVNVLFFLSIFWNTWAAAKASFSRRHVQDMMLGVDIVNEKQLDKIIGPKNTKVKKTNQQKLDDALGPDDGAGVDKAVEDGKMEDLEAAPAWEADPDDPPDSPVDISSRFFSRDPGGHSVASTVAVPSTFWGAPSINASPSGTGGPSVAGRRSVNSVASVSASASAAPLRRGGGSYPVAWGGGGAPATGGGGVAINTGDPGPESSPLVEGTE